MQSFGNSGRAQQIAPPFSLTSETGQTVKLWDYKQRNGLVLYFLNGNETVLLKRLATDAKLYRNHKAELLVLADAEQSQLAELAATSVTILADTGAKVRQKYLALVGTQNISGEKLPLAVFILDLYGAISHFQVAATPADLPEVKEIENILEYLSYLCKP
jgi:peroxiredoxin